MGDAGGERDLHRLRAGARRRCFPGTSFEPHMLEKGFLGSRTLGL